jgi:acetoin utilization protein AcuB
MTKQMPQVRDFMTHSPKKVPPGTPLEEAQKVMRESGIRHLLVEREGRLAGVLTERDVNEAILSQKHVAEEAMNPTPYIVRPDADLDLVVTTLAVERVCSAVVQEPNGQIVGIFTTLDACRAFGKLLEAQFPT